MNENELKTLNDLLCKAMNANAEMLAFVNALSMRSGEEVDAIDEYVYLMGDVVAKNEGGDEALKEYERASEKLELAREVDNDIDTIRTDLIENCDNLERIGRWADYLESDLEMLGEVWA